MIKVSTLRNIITLLVVLFFTACRTNNSSSYYISDLKSISSEDQYRELTQVAEIVSEERGRTIFVVAKK